MYLLGLDCNHIWGLMDSNHLTETRIWNNDVPNYSNQDHSDLNSDNEFPHQ
jgi:hypothetical protein